MSTNKINYKLINVKTIAQLKQEGNFLHSADYTIPIKDDNGEIAIAQFESINDDEDVKFVLENKVYDIRRTNVGLQAFETVIQDNNILEKNSLGNLVKKQMSLFFDNLIIYDELGIKNKKRAVLLHSNPGTGKTLTISRAAKDYSLNKNACVIVWPSDKIEPDEFKYFLSQQCDWSKIDKFVLIIEDIGGGNLDEGVKHNAVEAQLLNFLDGIDVVFEKPTFILATTNSPDSHLASLTSRPGRFDLVTKVPELTDDEKVEFFKFFSKSHWDDSLAHSALVHSKKFQICHIKESVIRSRLEMTLDKQTFESHLLRSIREIKDWIERQEAGRLAEGTQKQKFGFEV